MLILTSHKSGSFVFKTREKRGQKKLSMSFFLFFFFLPRGKLSEIAVQIKIIEKKVLITPIESGRYKNTSENPEKCIIFVEV